jgi:hypothetical protein
MRRLWAFTIAAAFLAMAASGADAQMRLGAKGGVTFSNVSMDPEDPDFDTESRTGFGGGAEVQLPLGMSGLVLQPELLYMGKGFEVTEDGATLKLKLDYVEIPVLFRFNIPAQAVMPFIYGGPVVSFEASCKVEGEEDGVSVDADSDAFGDDFDTESTDFGVLFGGGLAFAAGPGDLFVEGRYNIGLKDIDTADGFEAKNRSGAVMVGYSVSLDPTSR